MPACDLEIVGVGRSCAMVLDLIEVARTRKSSPSRTLSKEPCSDGNFSKSETAVSDSSRLSAAQEHQR
jgi:hypothetical protein